MNEEEFHELCATMLDIDGVTPSGVIVPDEGNAYLVTSVGAQKVAALFTYESDLEITCQVLAAEPISSGRWVPIYGVKLAAQLEPSARDRPNLVRKRESGLELSCRGPDGGLWWLPIPNDTIPEEPLEDNGEIGKRYSRWEISCMSAGNASGLGLWSPGHPRNKRGRWKGRPSRTQED